VDTFGFVVHPIDPKRDVAKKYPLLAEVLPTGLIHLFSRYWPPVYLSRVTGVRSKATGKEIIGHLIACPFTARQALQLPTRAVYTKIIHAGRLAQKLGAQILGLGAYASVVGDAGVTISHQLDIPVTTGHSLTVAMAIEGVEAVARRRNVVIESATASVVGATGSIGSACAELLAPLVGELILVGRAESSASNQRLERLRERVEAAGARRVRTSTQMDDVVEADLVVSTTSAAEPVIHSQHLKSGAIVCDVALPPDVSSSVKRERDDVVIIPGGVVDVPGEVDFGFDFGLPPGKAYACMAETMVLTLDGRDEGYSLGKQIRLDQVTEISQLARKHGFRFSPV
jgi:fatty aldehyde-generating acyl-ACP reductase